MIEAHVKYTLTGDDEKALFAAIERTYKLPAEIRTLTNFASILGPLGERLQRWTGKGQFGYLFDNAEDTLTFARFQTFNFDGWSDYHLMRQGYAKLVTALRTSSAWQRKMPPPNVITNLIVKALKARRPRTRYHGGTGAGPILFLRRHLSDRMFDRLIMSTMR